MGASERRWYRRLAWVIPFALGIMFALFGIGGALFIGVDPNDFASSTGTAWDGFLASDPLVGQYIDRLVRLIGVMGFGFGSWVAVAAYFWVRQGDRAGWAAMWLLPAVMFAAAAVFFMAAGAGLGSFYVGAFAIALVGQVLSYPQR